MQLIEHEHGFEIINFSLLLQVIRGSSVVTVEVLQIQVFKCKLTIVKWPDKCKYGVIYIIIDMLLYIYKKTIWLIWNFNSQFNYTFFLLFNPFSFKFTWTSTFEVWLIEWPVCMHGLLTSII